MDERTQKLIYSGKSITDMDALNAYADQEKTRFETPAQQPAEAAPAMTEQEQKAQDVFTGVNMFPTAEETSAAVGTLPGVQQALKEQYADILVLQYPRWEKKIQKARGYGYNDDDIRDFMTGKEAKSLMYYKQDVVNDYLQRTPEGMALAAAAERRRMTDAYVQASGLEREDVEDRMAVAEYLTRKNVPMRASMLINDDDLYKSMLNMLEKDGVHLHKGWGQTLLDDWEVTYTIGGELSNIGKNLLGGSEADYTPEVRKRIAWLQEQSAKLQTRGIADNGGIFNWMRENALKPAMALVSSLISSSAEGMMYGMGAEAVGYLGGPLAPITAPMAYGMGFTFGSLKNIAEAYAGNTMITLLQKNEENGNPMSFREIQGIATSVGILTGLIEGKLGGYTARLNLIPGAAKLLGYIDKPMLKDLVRLPEFSSAMARYAVDNLSNNFIGSINNTAEEVAVIAGEVLADVLSGQPFGNVKWGEHLDRVWNTFYTTALGSAVISVPGAMYNTYSIAKKTKGNALINTALDKAPEARTPKEKAALEARAKKVQETLIKEAQKSPMFHSEEAANIRDGLTRQFMEDGGMDEELARTNADLLTAFTINMKERNPDVDLSLGDFANVVVKSVTESLKETGAESYEQIIGQKGAARLDAADAGTRIDNLGVARQMEEAGKDAKTIWLATGWAKGKEGKWNYDLMDGEIKLPDLSNLTEEETNEYESLMERFFNGEELTEAEENRLDELGDIQYVTRKENAEKYNKYTLGKIYDAPELYAAYPELRYMPVVFGKISGANGEYSNGNIYLNLDFLKNYATQTTKHVLVHEIQHAIQHIEGFANGGNEKVAGMAAAKKYAALSSQIEELERRQMELPHAAEIQRAYDEDILSLDTLPEEDVAAFDAMTTELGKLERQRASMRGMDNFEAYKRLAGETQARNASTRMDMSPEERRQKLLSETEDVAREDQIVLRDALGAAESRIISATAEAKLAADEKSWRENVDGVLNGTIAKDAHVKVMTTPLVFTLTGAKVLPVYMNAKKIDTVVNGPHGVTSDILKQIPRALADPVAVFTSKTRPNTSIVVMTEIQDADGATVIVPVELNSKRYGYDINILSSVYAKKSDATKSVNNQWFIDQIIEGRLKYIDRQKSSQWANRTGLQLPAAPTGNEVIIPNETDLAKLRNQPGNETYYQRAWTGSPNRFEYFDNDYIGSGEGTQWEGYGHYASSKREIGEWYREKEEQHHNKGQTIRIGDVLYIYNTDGAFWEWNNESEGTSGTVNEAVLDDFLSNYDKDDPEAAFRYLEENAEDYDENELEEMTEYLRDNDIEGTAPGQLYEIEIPEDDVLMHRNQSIEEQSETIQQAVRELAEELGFEYNPSMTGEEVQNAIGQALNPNYGDMNRGDPAISGALAAHGLKGLRYTAGNGVDTNYVIFDGNDIDIVETYYQTLQRTGETVNAEISWQGGKAWQTPSLIEFFKTANASSGFHELGHHMLRVMMDISKLDGASAQLRDDVNTILEHAGVTMEEFETDQKKRTQAHEYFAQSWETYLSEGKAPTPELQGVFDRIREWMIEVYHDVVQALGIELSDEMRDVFDRLLATPDQLAEQRRIGDLAMEELARRDEMKRTAEEIKELEAEAKTEEASYPKDWDEITDEEGASYPADWDEITGADDSREEYAQIIGERGAAKLDEAEGSTIRQDNYQIALKMREAGKDAKAIKLATGWDWGADGEPRYEILDGDLRLGNVFNTPEKARYHRLLLKNQAGTLTQAERAELKKANEEWARGNREGQRFKLPDVYENDELYEAYPELRDVNVRLYPSYLNGGVWEADKKRIILSLDKLFHPSNRENWQFKHILAHEIQHAIQDIEGFARGAGIVDGYERYAGEVESRNVQWRMDMTEEERRNTPLVDTEDVSREDQVLMGGGVESYAQTGASAPAQMTESEIDEMTRDQIDAVRKQYEGTDQYMKAPNGKATNLTEKQWLQVRTPAFKVWFGDWENDSQNASKVLNENGEPLVVWHGTPEGTFSVFRTDMGGAYFSADRGYAEVYARERNGHNTPKIYGTFLNIKKPFDTRDAEARRIFEEEFFGNYGNRTPLTERGLLDWTEADDMIDFLQESGYDYDGIIVDEGGDPNSASEAGFNWRGLSYVALNPEQIKSATDNRGTFDAGDADIYHQEAINPADSETANSANEAALQAEGTDNATDSIEDYARAMDEYNVKKTAREYVDTITKLIKQNGGLRLEDFIHDVGEEAAKELRKKWPGLFRNTTQGPQLELDVLTQQLQANGIDLDVRGLVDWLTDTLNEKPEKPVPPTLTAKTLKAVVEKYGAEAASQYLAERKRYLEGLIRKSEDPSALKTITKELRAIDRMIAGEKAARQRNALKEHYLEWANRLKEKYEGKLIDADIRRRLELGSQKAKADTRLQQLKNRYKAMAERKAERKKLGVEIDKTVRSINRMAETESISWDRQQEIKALLEGYDLKRRSRKTMKRRAEVEALLETNYLDAQDARGMSESELAFLGITQKDLKYIGATTLNDMTLADLKELQAQVSAVFEQGKAEFEAWEAERQERRGEYRDGLKGSLDKKEGPEPKVVATNKELGKQYEGIRGALAKVKDGFYSAVMTPDRFFDWLDGGHTKYKGAFVRYFVDALNAAKDEAKRHEQERLNKMKKALNDLGFKMSDFSKKAADAAGRSWTWNEIMEIYIGMRNEKKARAILFGNFVNGNGQGPVMSVEEAQNTIRKLVGLLTPEHKQAAELVVQDHDANFNRINRKFIEAFNRGMEQEVDYSSIHRMEHQTRQGLIDVEDEAAMTRGLDNAAIMKRVETGFMQNRQEIADNNQAPIMLGLFSNWMNDVSRHEHAAAMAQIAGDLASAMLSRGEEGRPLMKQLSDKFGKDAARTLASFFDDSVTDGQRLAVDFLDSLSSKVARNMSVAYIAGNCGTVLKQLTSIPRFLITAGPMKLTWTTFRFLTNPKAFLERAYELDPQLADRGGNALMNAVLRDPEWGKAAYQRGLEWMFAPVSIVDRWVAAIGWTATYEANLAKGATKEHAIREAQRAVRLTQQAASAKDLPRFWRSGGYVKTVMAFTSDTAATLGMTAYDFVQQISSGEMNTTMKAFSTAFALAVTAIAMKAATDGISGDDDDEDGGVGAWLGSALTEAFITSLPLVGKEAMMLYEELSGKYRGTTYSAFLTPVVKLLKGLDLMFDEDSEEEQFWKASGMLLDSLALSGIAPIPSTAIRRAVQSVAMMDEGDAGNAARTLFGMRVRREE